MNTRKFRTLAEADLIPAKTATQNTLYKRFYLFPLLCCFLCSVFGSSPPASESNQSKNNPGFSYHHDEVRYVPWSIHLVKIERSNPDLEIQSMLGHGTTFGLTTVSEQIHLLPPNFGHPLAAINGDFYDKTPPYMGDPKGLQISRGELVSAPADWSCLWIDSTGNPQMGKVTSQFTVTWPNGVITSAGLNERRSANKAVIYTHAIGSSTHTSGGRELLLEISSTNETQILRVGENYSMRIIDILNNGDTPLTKDSLVLSVGPGLLKQLPKLEKGTFLQISTATLPNIKGASAAISGGPQLIHEKKAQYNASQARHPRSAVGWNKNFIFFVEVDGRQPGVSIGMTYAELADYMNNLGCEEALNFDGGGSSTLWVMGQVMNSPSQGDERGVANSLVLIQKTKSEQLAPGPKK